MAGIETGITAIENAFFYTAFAGQTWVLYLTIIVATMLLITRAWKDWGSLALPVMVGWRYYGMPIPYTFLIIASIIFVIDALSIKAFGGAFTGIQNIASRTFTRKGRLERLKRATDIKERVSKLGQRFSTQGLSEHKAQKEFEELKANTAKLRERKRFYDALTKDRSNKLIEEQTALYNKALQNIKRNKANKDNRPARSTLSGTASQLLSASEYERKYKEFKKKKKTRSKYEE